MSDQKTLITDFINSNDLGGYLQHPLPRDASRRRYIRLIGSDEQLILMDAPPAHENVANFIKLANHLRKLGLSAPEIYAADEENGILLLEDFGDNSFNKMLAYGSSEQQLYQDAIDVLIDLHNNKDTINIDLENYDLDKYKAEASLLTQWYLPEITGAKWTKTGNQAYLDAWDSIYNSLPKQPQTLTLRDYHVDNLMMLRQYRRPKNCGLLDFQDALIGSPSYDVASLLEDARRDIDDKLRQKMLKRYFAGVGYNDDQQKIFNQWYVMLAAQRHAKVAGIFIRLFRNQHKGNYLKHIPRVIDMLSNHLQNPLLKSLDDWFNKYLPNFRELPDIVNKDNI